MNYLLWKVDRLLYFNKVIETIGSNIDHLPTIKFNPN